MNSENFVYWLQGFLEISNTDSLNKEQVQIIKDHIALALTKVTPDYNLQAEESYVTLEGKVLIPQITC